MARLVRLTEVHTNDGYAWGTPRWLRNQIAAGKLSSYKVGGLVLIDLDDLDHEVEAGRRDAIAS